MELGVSHEQSLSSSTPIVDNIFDKYNKNLVPIRSLSDHDISKVHRIVFWQGVPENEFWKRILKRVHLFKVTWVG